MKPFLFNYHQMELLLPELRKRVIGFQFLRSFSEHPHRYYFLFSQGDRVEILFCSFAMPSVNFHLKHPIRRLQKDSVSGPFDALLPKASVKDIQLHDGDRILILTFKTSVGERRWIGEFFSKHPNCYLVDAEGQILFSSFPVNNSHYSLPALPNKSPSSPLEHNYLQSHAAFEAAFDELEKERSYSAAIHAVEAAINKQIKKLERKKDTLEKGLVESSQWEKHQHEAELFKANLDKIKKRMLSVNVWDWFENRTYTIDLDPSKSPQEQLKERFKRAKKLHASQQPLRKQLKIVNEDLEYWLSLQRQAQQIDTLEAVKQFQSTLPVALHRKTQQGKGEEPKQALPYKTFYSSSGVKIWVGKNGPANDRLTFQIANGRDWWLHASGHSGSHVIIRSTEDAPPDADTLQDAMLLALYYSKGRDSGECEICYTQRKYLSRVKNGKTGMVQMSKHKSGWTRFDPIRFEELKNRKRSNLHL